MDLDVDFIKRRADPLLGGTLMGHLDVTVFVQTWAASFTTAARMLALVILASASPTYRLDIWRFFVYFYPQREFRRVANIQKKGHAGFNCYMQLYRIFRYECCCDIFISEPKILQLGQDVAYIANI